MLCCAVLCVGSIAGCENLYHSETGTIGLRCTGVCARVYIHIYFFSIYTACGRGRYDKKKQIMRLSADIGSHN